MSARGLQKIIQSAHCIHRSVLSSSLEWTALSTPIRFATKLSIQMYVNRGDELSLHLCAWGNDAVNEVKPRRVNCWLKTISNPPAVPARAPQNFCKVCHRLGPHNLEPNLYLHLGESLQVCVHVRIKFRELKFKWCK
jgi:hypothetical protein